MILYRTGNDFRFLYRLQFFGFGWLRLVIITYHPLSQSKIIIIFINSGCGLTIYLHHLHFFYRADAPVLGHLWEYIFGDDIYG